MGIYHLSLNVNVVVSSYCLGCSGTCTHYAIKSVNEDDADDDDNIWKLPGITQSVTSCCAFFLCLCEEFPHGQKSYWPFVAGKVVLRSERIPQPKAFVLCFYLFLFSVPTSKMLKLIDY